MSKAKEIISLLEVKKETIKSFEPSMIDLVTDRHKIWELGEVNGFLNKWIKLSAKAQRQLFGINMFGKKSLYFDVKNNRIRVAQSVAFGGDANIYLLNPEDLVRMVKEKKVFQV